MTSLRSLVLAGLLGLSQSTSALPAYEPVTQDLVYLAQVAMQCGEKEDISRPEYKVFQDRYTLILDGKIGERIGFVFVDSNRNGVVDPSDIIGVGPPSEACSTNIGRVIDQTTVCYSKFLTPEYREALARLKAGSYCSAHFPTS